MEQLEKIAEQWNSLKNDSDRWRMLLNYRESMMVVLDNDQTYIAWTPSAIKSAGFDPTDHEGCADVLQDLNEFDGYIGWNCCVMDLLDAIGIRRYK